MKNLKTITILKSLFIYLSICLCGSILSGQSQQRQSELIHSIQPIEHAMYHYETLQLLDSEVRSSHSWMDTIVFPPDLYNRYALTLKAAAPTYLTQSQVDFLVGSVSFPKNSSLQTRAELDYLLELQAKRSDGDVQRVMKLAKLGYWPDANFSDKHLSYKQNLEDLFFECQEVVGQNCTAENYPHTSKLLQGVMNDMRKMEYSVKYDLLRARPYQLEPKLEQLQTMGSPSFASGHTLWAYIQAYTFSELMPDRRKAFLDIAYELGESREIMGVHYPSDEEVARQLAHRMLMLMWHTDKFQQDFALAQEEWN